MKRTNIPRMQTAPLPQPWPARPAYSGGTPTAGVLPPPGQAQRQRPGRWLPGAPDTCRVNQSKGGGSQASRPPGPGVTIPHRGGQVGTQSSGWSLTWDPAGAGSASRAPREKGKRQSHREDMGQEPDSGAQGWDLSTRAVPLGVLEAFVRRSGSVCGVKRGDGHLVTSSGTGKDRPPI